MSAPPPRTPSATFRPHFTLSLLYLAFFFLAYSLLLVAPELSDVVRPASPEDEEVMKQAAAAATQGVVASRLPWALALAFATLYLGVRQRLLPGMRRPVPR